MKKNILITMKKEVVILGMVLLCMNLISAFGVSSLYYNGHPLTVMPGETKNFTLVLMSSENSETILKATIPLGSDILKIADSSDTYTVPALGRQTVNLQVTVPKDAKAETIYPVRVSFAQVLKGGGMIGFATAIDQNFDILVAGSPSIFDRILKNNTWIYIVGGLLIVCILMFTLLRKKRAKKARHHKRK